MAQGGERKAHVMTKATTLGRRRTQSGLASRNYAGNSSPTSDSTDVSVDKERTLAKIVETEASPLPIAQIVRMKNGETRFKAIPGFEHLFSQTCVDNVQAQVAWSKPAQVQAPHTRSSKTTLISKSSHHQDEDPSVQLSPRTVREKKKDIAKLRPSPRKRGPKRSRSAAKLEVPDIEIAFGPPIQHVETRPTHTFLISDVNALEAFMKSRLKELRMKPLRKIVTEWINKIYLPNRRQWPYHKDKEIPSRIGTTKQPAEWTKYLSKIPYKEPAHLKEEYLIPLAIHILLAHRYSDESGRIRQPWVSKLEDCAFYACRTMKDQDFFAGKPDPAYYSLMKERAVGQILPDIFEQAKRYEDHVAQYNLYDGRESSDPESKKGVQITWHDFPLPKKAGELDLLEGPHKRQRLYRRINLSDHNSLTDFEDQQSIRSGSRVSTQIAFADNSAMLQSEGHANTVPNTPMLSPPKLFAEMARTVSTNTDDDILAYSPTFSHHSLHIPHSVPQSDATIESSMVNHHSNSSLSLQLTGLSPYRSAFYQNSSSVVDPIPNSSFTSTSDPYIIDTLDDTKIEPTSSMLSGPIHVSQQAYGGGSYMGMPFYRMQGETIFTPQYNPAQYTQAGFIPIRHAPLIFNTDYNGTNLWPAETQHFLGHSPVTTMDDCKNPIVAGQNPFAPPTPGEGNYTGLQQIGATPRPPEFVQHDLSY